MTLSGKTGTVKRAFQALAIAAALATLSAACAGEGILSRTNPKTYHVLFRFSAERGAKWPDRLLLTIPVIESNAYQDVRLIGPVPGKKKRNAKTGNAYAQQHFLGSELRGRESASIEYECEVTLYDIAVDFSRVRATEHYRKDAEYMLYTGKSGNYIDPEHPEIVRVSRELGMMATDNIDYARRAYEFVAKNYRYLNRKGFGSFEKVMERGGGHCGDLCSIFIALLRRAGIPARHLMGHLVNDETHIIAEFYVEGCGWIPVDVTYRNSHPDRDYFGRIPRGSMPIVISRDIGFMIDVLSGEKRVSSLQRGYGSWKPKKPAPRLIFYTNCREAE